MVFCSIRHVASRDNQTNNSVLYSARDGDGDDDGGDDGDDGDEGGDGDTRTDDDDHHDDDEDDDDDGGRLQRPIPGHLTSRFAPPVRDARNILAPLRIFRLIMRFLLILMIIIFLPPSSPS